MPHYDEIVGAKIGSIITNKPDIISQAVKAGRRIQWLRRPHIQLMASFDLGARWENMAKGPTLFLMNKEGHIIQK